MLFQNQLSLISQETIQKIYDAALIEEVVGEFVELKKRGTNLLGVCPFHDEKTPSFTVSPAKNIFKCFGCGQGGDSVRFLMEHEQLSFPEALKQIAQRYNIEVEETHSETNVQDRDDRESLMILTSHAQKWFSEKLTKSTEGKNIGLSYFKERGFLESTIEKFNLGYSPDSWTAFSEHALEQGFKAEFLEAAGLAKRGKEGKFYDGYRGRVIFPIHNLTGRVIALAGRILKTDKKAPKYVNSPENLIYHKSNVLYGMYFAKKAIKQNDRCLLVEGYTDVISLNQNGIENVVASSGTSLTEGQIRLIRRFTPNITILYDGDAAGIKAALRGIDLCLHEGLNVKVALLPEGHDPDSFIREKGTSGFEKFMAEESTDFIVFKTRFLLAESGDDPVKRSEVIRDIVSSIAQIPDSIKASLFIKQCAGLLDIEERLLISELNKMKLQEFKKNRSRNVEPMPEEYPPEFYEAEAAQPKEKQPESHFEQEKEVVRLLLNYGNEPYDEEGTVGEYILAELEDVIFESEELRDIVAHCKKTLDESQKIDSALLLRPDGGNDKLGMLATAILSSRYVLSENWEKHDIFVPAMDSKIEKSIVSSLIHLKVKKVLGMMKDNEEKLKEANKLEDITLFQTVHMKLNTLKMELGKQMGSVII